MRKKVVPILFLFALSLGIGVNPIDVYASKQLSASELQLQIAEDANAVQYVQYKEGDSDWISITFNDREFLSDNNVLKGYNIAQCVAKIPDVAMKKTAVVTILKSSGILNDDSKIKLAAHLLAHGHFGVSCKCSNDTNEAKLKNILTAINNNRQIDVSEITITQLGSAKSFYACIGEDGRPLHEYSIDQLATIKQEDKLALLKKALYIANAVFDKIGKINEILNVTYNQTPISLNLLVSLHGESTFKKEGRSFQKIPSDNTIANLKIITQNINTGIHTQITTCYPSEWKNNL